MSLDRSVTANLSLWAKKLILKNELAYRAAITFQAFVVLGFLGRVYSLACGKLSRRSKLATNETPFFSNFDTDLVVNQIKTQGYSCFGTLSNQYVDSLVSYCNKINAANYNNPHEFYDVVHGICHNEKIISVVRKYFGVEPTLMGSRIWWHFPPSYVEKEHIGNESPGSPSGAVGRASWRDYRKYTNDNSFHFDTIDVKSLTLFIYLSDVDHLCAPHTVIEGTAHANVLKKIFKRFLTDEEAESLYGDRIKPILGPKGTAFLEDLTTYHKVQVAEEPRLVLRANYTLQRGRRSHPAKEAALLP